MNLIQPILFANSNFAPTSHRTTRRTPQIIKELIYVGNSGSNKLLERSTDMLLGVTCEEVRKTIYIKRCIECFTSAATSTLIFVGKVVRHHTNVKNVTTN